MGIAAIKKVTSAGVTLATSTDNQVATVTGANALTGESNLTFDGTDLAVGNAAPSSYINSVHGIIVGDTGDATSEIVIATSTTGSGKISWTDTADTTNQAYILYNHNDNDLTFHANGNDRMHIDVGGEVGIGTTGPSAKLHVVGGGDDEVGHFQDPNTGGYSAGRTQVLIQYTAQAPDNNNQRFLRCWDTGGDRCYIYSDGDLANHDGTYGTISDVKFKQDIADVRSYWDDFKALRYRKFRHKSDVEADANAPYRLGLIAQEVETIFPALVPESPDAGRYEFSVDADGKKVKTYVESDTTHKWVKSSIIEGPIMASVVQELMARVESLQAQVAALQGA